MSTHWDNRFMQLAALTATWSKDPKRKVGCVIIDPPSRTVLSGGYNGFPRGVVDSEERLVNQDVKLSLIVHAEANAVAAAARNGHTLLGSHAFITRPPCAQCAALLIQAGIKRVVFAPFETEHSKWEQSLQLALTMFSEASVIWEMRTQQNKGEY